MKGCKNRNSFKRIICFYLIKDSIFYEIIITVFHFTQRAIENRCTCHACRRLPTPDLGIPTVQEVTHERSIKHRTNLESPSNPLLQPIPRDNVIRRLNRLWPADLQYGQRDLLAGGDLIALGSLQVTLPASTLAYRILCALIADLNLQK